MPTTMLAVAGQQPHSDENVWVTRDMDGNAVAIPVSQMSDQHLASWVRYFRRKYRSDFPQLQQQATAVVDLAIQRYIVTAKSIYREAQQRGINLQEDVAERLKKPVRSARLSVVRFASEVRAWNLDFYTQVMMHASDLVYEERMTGIPRLVISFDDPALRERTLELKNELGIIASTRIWGQKVAIVAQLGADQRLPLSSPSQFDLSKTVTRVIELEEEC